MVLVQVLVLVLVEHHSFIHSFQENGSTRYWTNHTAILSSTSSPCCSEMTSWLQLAHKTVIVTGAGSGIGAMGYV